MTVKLEIDHVNETIKVINKLYPKLDVVINLHDDAIRKTYGFTEFYENGEIYVSINVKTPYWHVGEIIAHEISHVLTGYKAKHNKQWEKIFKKIGKECQRHFKILSKR